MFNRRTLTARMCLTCALAEHGYEGEIECELVILTPEDRYPYGRIVSPNSVCDKHHTAYEFDKVLSPKMRDIMKRMQEVGSIHGKEARDEGRMLSTEYDGLKHLAILNIIGGSNARA